MAHPMTRYTELTPNCGTGGPQRGGPPGPPGMMRAASGRPGGVQADVWSRGTQQAPLTPGGPLSGIQLHKTQNSFKVGCRWSAICVSRVVDRVCAQPCAATSATSQACRLLG